jgi:amino-acid N-acetyltransferase
MIAIDTRAAGAHLRPAKSADLPNIEQLLTASSLPVAGVTDALSGFIVAEADGAIVGTAAIEICRENALLRSVAVAPEWRARGLGRALVTRAVAEAEARGIRALYLLTTTAEHYFPSFGFRQITRDAVPTDVQETDQFQNACCASAVVMCRSCVQGS